MFVTPLNITYDVSEALDYLSILETKFVDRRWFFYELGAEVAFPDIEERNERITEFSKQDTYYCWNIVQDDVSIWQPAKLDKTGNKQLIFGFAEKVLNLFPGTVSAMIAGHMPGARFEQHIDPLQDFRVHIPIKTDLNAGIIDEHDNLHFMKAGQAYALDTSFSHGTVNTGTRDRVHLILKTSREVYNEVLAMNGVI